MENQKNDRELSGNNGKGRIRIDSLSLTVKDVIWILTAVISIVLAWGLYGSRITVLETLQISTTSEIQKIKDDLDKLKEVNIKQDKKILELQLKNNIAPRE